MPERFSPQGFTPAELAALREVGEVRKVDRGELLFRRDEIGDSMFLIEEGGVELRFAPGAPGKQLGPGDSFGELALLSGQHRRTATAASEEGAKLLRIDEAALERLFEARPRLLVDLLRRTCRYLLASEDRLIASLRAQNRVLERTLDYLRRTREEVGYQELLANTDQLTGLYNRRCLDRQLPRFLSRADATKSGLALLLADVDRFKSVNDEHGHAAGDAVLRAVASAIRMSVRTSDLPCRFGGDEFAIVLVEIDTASAGERADDISRRVRQLEPDAILPTEVSISLGATMHQPGDSPETLFGRADTALYRAKKAGRDQVVWSRGEPGEGA